MTDLEPGWVGRAGGVGRQREPCVGRRRPVGELNSEQEGGKAVVRAAASPEAEVDGGRVFL